VHVEHVREPFCDDEQLCDDHQPHALCAIRDDDEQLPHDASLHDDDGHVLTFMSPILFA